MYFERVGQSVFGAFFKNIKGIKTLNIREGVKQNYAYYPILVNQDEYGINRDVLIKKLSENGISARKYFYPLVSENKEFGKDLTLNTPNAFYYSRNVLCLPMYAELALSDVDKICDIIKK